MTSRKVAIVTAGGSGMGAGAARKLAEDGFDVAVLSSSGKGEALAKELGGIGVTGSNQSNEDLQTLVDAVMERWGRVDVLVNSAGHGPRGPVLELSDEDWHQGMEVYFLSAVRPTRLVTPIMQAQKLGSIINISTFAAFEPDAVFPTSGVFRAGLAAFTKLFADKVRGGQCPHEQRVARLHRQSAGEAGVSRPHSDATLRQDGRDRGGDRHAGLRRRRVRHRTEYPGRRRHHPFRIKPNGRPVEHTQTGSRGCG